MNNNKTILKINMFWMIVIYIVLSVLAFWFSIKLGIIVTIISILSYGYYIFLSLKLKKIVKAQNESNT